jgi:hypothetical protein
MTDDTREANPVDAELIAYLDGELAATDARRIEDQLDADPELRARAESLKRSYDLLDFLPKPEPSSTFATRTMDRLPASGSANPTSATASVPTAIPAGTSSLALADRASAPFRNTWMWAIGLAAAIGAAIGIGYLGSAATRTYFFHEPPSRGFDSLPLADIPVIEKLPLYAAVDDFEFLSRLAAPEFFAHELAMPEGISAPPMEREKPSSKRLDDLSKLFRELPSDQQERIRTLDRQINAQEPAKRDRSFRLLETYAAWLQRLPDADRKDVLSAATHEKRLEAVREVQRKQWIAGLPAAQRQQFNDVPAEVKADLIKKWKAEEEKNRDAWATARMRWEAVRTGRQPWPFADEKMRKEVLAYVIATYHPDEPNRSRLTSFGPDGGDAGRMKEALERAEKGEWPLLGKAVYDFSKKYEMLPEPRNGRPVIEIADLSTWPAAVKHFENRPNARRKVEPSVGKWPEFALAVHAEIHSVKLGANLPSHQLGPCRPDELKDDVRKVLAELKKKSTETELNGLKAVEGKWPEFPRELVRLARTHDLSVPGAMPPGPPSQWERTYNLARPMPRPGG